jgi:hypothetical protein
MPGYDDFSSPVTTAPARSDYDAFSSPFEAPPAPEAPHVPFYADTAHGEINVNRDARTRAQFEASQTRQNAARAEEESRFAASRTPLTRLMDASTFALSMPVRAFTQGEYGLGDIVSNISPSAGRTYREQERNFARANRTGLEYAAAAGDVAMGIPGLQSMGVVPGEMLATTRAAVRDPAALRVAPRQTYNFARGVVGLEPTDLPPSRPAPPPAARPVAAPEQAYAPAQRIIDRAAFQAEGIPEFAPAFGSKGLARSARTIEETPLVGGTVKVPKTAVEQAMAMRQGQIAEGLGAAGSPEDVGLIAQRGLARFRSAGLEDLDRSTVEGLDIAPNRPRVAGGSVTIDKPGQLNTAAMSDAELERATHSSNVDLPGSTRTRVEELTPEQVTRIVGLPARDTSFATKASALYQQASDATARIMRKNETVNPGRLGIANTRSVVQGIANQEKMASISGGVLSGRFGDLARRVLKPTSHMSLDDIRAVRTEVGRALSNFGEFDVRLDKTQLKQLYGALSDDYQTGLVALAARARKATRLPVTAKDYVSPAVADAADKALQRYRVADRYYRSGIERMDRFMQVLGADTLEQASRKIGQYLRENTQNVRALESMASSLRPEEWKSILGHVVANLGKLTPGAREAEKIFSFERYATDWNKINQNPRVTAMFRKALGDTVVTSLQNMGRIAERMKYYETTKNYSGSAYTAFGGATLATLWNPVAWPLLIGSIAGTGLTGKVLTSQKFAAWVNSLNRAQVRVGSSVTATKQAAAAHLQRLSRLAAKEPDPEVMQAMKALGVVLRQQLEATNRQ